MRKLVPSFILEKYRSGELRGSLQAAGLFVDLAGFSRMADVLTQHGQNGAETLTEVMRLVFDPMVNAVYSHGGVVVGYAGDSFTAIFFERQGEGPVMMRSLAAAVKMQEHLHSYPEVETRYGKFPISFKVGLGYGETKWQIFTSADGRHATFCIRGESVRSSVVAEEHAEPGKIVTYETVYEAVKDLVDAVPEGDCYRVEKVIAELPAYHFLPDPEPDPDIIRIFVPDEILHLPIIGEFREVVTAFVDIPAGISDEALVAPFMETVYVLQERYGGFFLRPDVGDKGFNLLMFWGAPTAHETDIVRAVNFVLELVERTRLDYRVGLTYRIAYSGFMGAELREDYTAYGWGLNLSARLMEAAGNNEIWMDEQVARRASTHFDVEYLDEFYFKGFARRQKTFKLVGRKELSEKIYQGETIGRHAETQILSSFLEPLWEGQFAGAMIIQGDAGIGKSRLVHTFQTSNLIPSNAKWILCQSDEILRQSFSPFKSWLSKKFNYLEGRSNEVNFKSFLEILQELIDGTPDPDLAAELARTSSILAALLNLTQENSLYQQLDAKGRYENTLIALSVLFRAESLQSPLILFMEDTHWLDDDTRAFLPYFVRTLLAESDRQYAIAIVATQRPDSEILSVDNKAYEFHLKLGTLTYSDLSRLAKNVLEAPLNTSLLDLLYRRSDGNPFFAEQLIRYLMDNSYLLLGQDGTYESMVSAEWSLPTDVNALLIARLDSLTHDVRDTVQTASVLGREFEVRLLGEMLKNDMDFMEKMVSAEQHDIWFALNEIAYIFRHALLRDAAYSMQIQARRRKLHEIALAAIETVYLGDLTGHYGELAYHAERADIVEKALDYLVKAGKAASDVFQNNQAADYYTRALVYAPDEDLQTRFDLIYERVSVYQNIANRVQELQDIDTLEKLASKLQNPEKIVRVMYLRSHYLFTIGNLADALEIAKQTIEKASKLGEDKTTLETYTFIIGPLIRTGRFEEALQIAEEGLTLARRTGNRTAESRLLNLLGLVAIERNEFVLALNSFQEALKISRVLKDKYLESSCLNNLANSVVAMNGDYSSAREYYGQSYAIDHERGDRYKESIALGNLGWLEGSRGNFSVARKYLEQSLVIAREVNHLYQELYVLVNLSNLLGMMGDLALALQYANEGFEISLKIGDRSGEGWSYLNMGHAYFLMDNLAEAQKAYGHCHAIREELKQPNLAAEAMAGLVQTALRNDEALLAKQWSEKLFSRMEIDRTFAGADDPLRIYYACYQAFENLQDPRTQVVLQNAMELLDAQASKFQEDEWRMYVESVPWRKALIRVGRMMKSSSS